MKATELITRLQKTVDALGDSDVFICEEMKERYGSTFKEKPLTRISISMSSDKMIAIILDGVLSPGDPIPTHSA